MSLDEMQDSCCVCMTRITPVIKLLLFPTVKVTERPAGEQRPPHSAPEEEGVRAGGGEEEPIGVARRTG